MQNLAYILAKLYPDHDKVRFFLLKVGLDPERINLEGNAVSRWERVIDEAWKHKKLQRIVIFATQEYKFREAELKAAMERYLNARSNIIFPKTSVSLDSNEIYSKTRYFLDRWLPDLHRVLVDLGLLTTPIERVAIINYLREFRAQIRDEFRNKRYLPLAVKKLPGVSPIDQEVDSDSFVSPVRQVFLQLIGRSYGGDSASAQIAASCQKSRVVRNILRHMERAKEPLILLGEPGSGKTMSLQKAALLLAERGIRQIFPLVPVYVRLGEFYAVGTVNKETVLAYVRSQAPSSIREQINRLEHEGRLIIFFDGMDEMSRERYGEHTQALSIFADYTFSKTLFSCRITDFSTKFLHQRLVLQPFQRNQVIEYLSKYVPKFPMIINGQPWKLKTLARYIVRGELPVVANNPFVLWLLCLYLLDKKSWPESRVEMLRYYNEQNYRRKKDEQSVDEPPFPDMKLAFQEWARIAFLITERNRGSAIPVQLLQKEQDDVKLQDMIWIGKRCGILEESRSKHTEHLIRFEHHRFQEFFAALHIHENRPPINWLERFSAPRWQETMINLILLGEADDVICEFSEAVTRQTQKCWAEVEKLRNEEEPEIVLPYKLETMLADHVELLSRILYHSAVSMANLREVLSIPFRNAVSLLADIGNPITQVKMMRACQNFRNIDFIASLKKPLNSPVMWVRNQALLLIAGSRQSERAIGSDFNTEIAYDMANGIFLNRLPVYWKALCNARRGSFAWPFVVGVCCALGNIVVLLAVAASLYYGLWSLRSVQYKYFRQGSSGIVHEFTSKLNPLEWAYYDKNEWKSVLEIFARISSLDNGMPKYLIFDFYNFSILGHPLFLSIACMLVTILLIVNVKIRPLWLWDAIFGWIVGIAVFAPVALYLLEGNWVVPLFAFAGMVCMGPFLYAVAGLIAFMSQFIALGIYGLLTMLVAKTSMRLVLTAAWQSSYMDRIKLSWRITIFSIIVLFFYALGVILGFLLKILSGVFLSVVQVVSDFSHLPFHPLMNFCIVLFLMLSAIVILRFWKSKGLQREENDFRSGLSRALGVLRKDPVYFAIAALYLTAFFVSAYFGYLYYIIVANVYIIILGGSAWALWGSRKFWRRIGGILFKGLRKTTSDPIDANEWLERIELADAETQSEILRKTEIPKPSHTTTEYLEILKEIRPLVKEEPSLSVYWELRYRLEEELRQERHG